MALTALNWKQLPSQIGVYTTPALALAAINTAFSSSTYANGAARTPGAGIAWTATTFLNGATVEGVGLKPVGSTLDSYCVIAGTVASQASATYATYSSAGANLLFVGTGKNVTGGSPYAANWYGPTNGSPFTSGQFTGYNRIGLVTTALTANSTIRCYESQDAIMVTLEYNGTIALSCIAGAYLDPQSSNAACAESDGKLYGCATGAANSTSPATALGAFTGTWSGPDTGFGGPLNGVYFLNGYPAASSGATYSGHNYVFVPGAATLYLLQLCYGLYEPGGSLSFRTRSNQFVRFPILVGKASAALSGGSPRFSQTFVGRVREIFNIGEGATNGQKITNAGSDVGYIAAYSSISTAFPAILLTT